MIPWFSKLREILTLHFAASPSPLRGKPTQAQDVALGSKNPLLLHKNSSQSFIPFRELLFLHKNNTMVVLLKTTLVRISFIQIMQIIVQNKRKSVRKSRYVGDVSKSEMGSMYENKVWTLVDLPDDRQVIRLQRIYFS